MFATTTVHDSLLMASERILQIREYIKEAQKNERETNSLEHYLETKLPHMHHAIKLPEGNRAQAMVRFLTSYIEHVPDFVEALTEISQQAGIYEHAKIFIGIAEDYFLQPPDILNDRQGLHALIDEAYLAHRLIEEVNDQIMVDCGMPLAPIDMTISNIVVHDLIGEEFANQLDLAVHYAIEALFQQQNFSANPKFSAYIEDHKKNGWNDILEKWPCLAGDSSIELSLTSKTDEDSLH